MSEVVKIESKTTFKYDGVSGLNSAIVSLHRDWEQESFATIEFDLMEIKWILTHQAILDYNKAKQNVDMNVHDGVYLPTGTSGDWDTDIPTADSDWDNEPVLWQQVQLYLRQSRNV